MTNWNNIQAELIKIRIFMSKIFDFKSQPSRIIKMGLLQWQLLVLPK